MFHEQTMTVLPKRRVDEMSRHMRILYKMGNVLIPAYSSNLYPDKADIVMDRKPAIIRFNMYRDDSGTLKGDLKCRRNDIDAHTDISCILWENKEYFDGYAER